MTWTKPHISKIYEALGAIGDERIEFIEGKNEAKIYSSSGNKFYTVTWNDDLTEMMSNDNSAFWSGKLSYPMIAVLMLKGKINYDKELPDTLKGIQWKDLNQKFKNNFDSTIEYVISELDFDGIDVTYVENEIVKVAEQIDKLEIKYLGNKVRPPKGY